MSQRLAQAVVRDRAADRCEGCGGRSSDFAHRVASSHGGLWIPSNGLRLCGPGNAAGCHGWQHAHPALAEAAGWTIVSGQHPSEVPVFIRTWLGYGWVLLDDEGGFEPLYDHGGRPELPPAVGATLAMF